MRLAERPVRPELASIADPTRSDDHLTRQAEVATRLRRDATDEETRPRRPAESVRRQVGRCRRQRKCPRTTVRGLRGSQNVKRLPVPGDFFEAELFHFLVERR